MQFFNQAPTGGAINSGGTFSQGGWALPGGENPAQAAPQLDENAQRKLQALDQSIALILQKYDGNLQMALQNEPILSAMMKERENALLQSGYPGIVG